MKKILLSLCFIVGCLMPMFAEGGMRLLTTSFKHPELAKWAAENPVVLENFTRQDFVGLPNFNDYDDVKNAADSLANTHGFIVLEHTRPIFWESALNKDSLYELEIEKKVRNGYNFQGGYLVFEYSYEDGILPKLRVLFRHFQTTQKVNPEELKKEKIINLLLNETYQEWKELSKWTDTEYEQVMANMTLHLENVDLFDYFEISDALPSKDNNQKRNIKAYAYDERGSFLGEAYESERGVFFYKEHFTIAFNFNLLKGKYISTEVLPQYLVIPERLLVFKIGEKESQEARSLFSESCNLRPRIDGNKTVMAIAESYGLCYIDSEKRLKFQKIDNNFQNYIVSYGNFAHPIVRQVSGIEKLEYYPNDKTYVALWHTHPDFQYKGKKEICDIKFGYGYPSGIGLPCNNYGHADIQGSPLRVEAPDFKRAWKLPGGIGIIPSSKGITIFRHDTGYYKRFSEQNKPSTCEYSYFDATAKIWYCRVSDYNFYTENPIGYNFQTRENNKTGGFRIFAYDFSYAIYGKPNVDYKN